MSEWWRYLQLMGCVAPALFLAVAVSSAQTSITAPQPAAGVEPKQILRANWEDNEAQMQLALNAQKAAHSPAVVAYARLIVVDAKATRQALLPVMKQRGVEVASQMVNQKEARIAAKTGDDFDLAYLGAEIVHLQDDVTRFRGYQGSNDKDVQQAANKMLPLIQQHLSLAEAASLGLVLANQMV